MGWGKRQPKDEFKNGHLAEFEIKEVDEKNRRLKVELSQVPAVQGAMMTLNAKTGEIVTMVGGYDFYTNKFNNATQAYRQTGSAFKPFIYTAAVEWGMTPETPVSGAPIKINDWQPHNYDGSLGGGDLPMKTALAKSMNIPGSAPAANSRHSNRRADGPSLWCQGADVSLPAVGAWAPLKCRSIKWSPPIRRFQTKAFASSHT